MVPFQFSSSSSSSAAEAPSSPKGSSEPRGEGKGGNEAAGGSTVMEEGDRQQTEGPEIGAMGEGEERNRGAVGDGSTGFGTTPGLVC